MIKLIIFDLDGVLVDSKMTHYEALNLSLGDIDAKYIISMDDHLCAFDGLPTAKKLEKLSNERGLSLDLHSQVWENKQKYTKDVIRTKITVDYTLIELFDYLYSAGITIYVASNSIRDTVKLYLIKLGLIEYVEDYISTDDIQHPKPHCEMYLKAMADSGFEPSESLIVEDSQVGLRAALKSGANVMRVNSPTDVTIDNITTKMNKINDTMLDNVKWQGGDLNILIPMAGAGSRFAVAGYTFPKPLIDVNGKPMIQEVVENLNISANYIYIVRKEHYETYNLKYLLNIITPNCKIIQVDELTEGACCTTLLAKEFIDNDSPLLIANSDQYVEWDSSEFMYFSNSGNIDGSMVTFKNIHPKWSYVALGEDRHISEVAEKKVISDIATVGIYYWSKGADYVKYSHQMIEKNIRVNGEFYVAPVYNEAILDGKKFKPYNISKMWGLGTPEDLKFFIENK